MEAQVGRVAVGSRRKPWRSCVAAKRGLVDGLESEKASVVELARKIAVVDVGQLDLQYLPEMGGGDVGKN